MLTYQESSIAAHQVLVSTGILKQESKFINKLIKQKRAYNIKQLLALSNLIN